MWQAIWKGIVNMKKTSLILAVFVLVFALCACGNGKTLVEDPQKEDNGQKPPMVTDENQPTEPASSPVPDQAPDNDIAEILVDADVFALAVKHFDMSGYDDRLSNNDNAVDHRIDTAVVDGINLTIGMKYSEVVQAGFTATDESFSEVKTGGLAYLCGFSTPSGNEVILAFCGEDGETVADGWLYSVSIAYDAVNQADVSVENINGGSSIENVVSAFGLPRKIDQIKYDVGYMLRLEYRCDGCSLYINATIDPMTAKVIDLELEGYPD